MPPPRIFLTGAAGFLGWNFARYFLERDTEVVGTWHRDPPETGALSRSFRIDLASPMAQFPFNETRPEAVIHCAALSTRRDCEADPLRARAVNVDASLRLAKSAREHGARFVFISTDLVFDGSDAPYREEDAVSPISLYAETKAEAERAVLSGNPESYIIRTALMYGNGPGGKPGSFLKWTVGALRTGEPLSLYENQYRTPLYAPDVPRLIALLLTRDAAPGIYHAAGPDRLSRLEIGRRVAVAFNLPDRHIIPARVDRPAHTAAIDDCSLSTSKAEALGMRFTSLDEGLRIIQK